MASKEVAGGEHNAVLLQVIGIIPAGQYLRPKNGPFNQVCDSKNSTSSSVLSNGLHLGQIVYAESTQFGSSLPPRISGLPPVHGPPEYHKHTSTPSRPVLVSLNNNIPSLKDQRFSAPASTKQKIDSVGTKMGGNSYLQSSSLVKVSRPVIKSHQYQCVPSSKGKSVVERSKPSEDTRRFSSPASAKQISSRKHSPPSNIDIADQLDFNGVVRKAAINKICEGYKEISRNKRSIEIMDISQIESKATRKRRIPGKENLKACGGTTHKNKGDCSRDRVDWKLREMKRKKNQPILRDFY